jgi:hypothetical protein
MSGVQRALHPDGINLVRRKMDFHYLKVAAPGGEPRVYPSLEGALEAIKDLFQLQLARGFTTARDADGRNTSRHPDGRTVQFWAENGRGDIVS